jgi:prolyl oligopeptidase
VPVADAYHGVKVVDDYRWLEKGDDPKVKAWSDAQNAWARAHLDRLPGVDTLRAEVSRIRKIAVPRYGRLMYAGPTLFALKVDPPRQQPLLVALASEDDPASARVVVDPNTMDPSGGTSIDWFVPSPDGARVAVSLSKGGSERGDAHVFDVATGKEVGEAVTRVNYGTALGSLAWDQDGNGFFYTRYPREGERPAADMDFYVQVYHHRIGTPPAGDGYEIGKEFPRIAEIWLDRSPDGRFILANVQNGDGGEFAQYCARPTAGGRRSPRSPTGWCTRSSAPTTRSISSPARPRPGGRCCACRSRRSRYAWTGPPPSSPRARARSTSASSAPAGSSPRAAASSWWRATGGRNGSAPST